MNLNECEKEMNATHQDTAVMKQRDTIVQLVASSLTVEKRPREEASLSLRKAFCNSSVSVRGLPLNLATFCITASASFSWPDARSQRGDSSMSLRTSRHR